MNDRDLIQAKAGYQSNSKLGKGTLDRRRAAAWGRCFPGIATTPAGGHEEWGDVPDPLIPRLERERIAWCTCYTDRFLGPPPDSLNLNLQQRAWGRIFLNQCPGCFP